jgi:putative radical SAM enzyme (TIGR03279 family)
MVKIKAISARSIAEKAGIPPGELISINGFEINDFLDYDYYNKEKELTLKVKTDKIYTYCITKREYDDIGLIFDSFLMDEVKSCKNKCIFCFIDQNPKGMRESIYFKDDDSRLSFISGNYITLTNLTERDILRIIKMKIPVNISLHTMNPELRAKMMGNRFAGDCIENLRRIAAAGNKVNIQLVLCRGINDGDELRFTLRELYNLGNINAIAAVPVGLTAHRDGLCPLTPFDRASARAVIDITREFAEKFAARDGRRTVYASDEFFLLAGEPIPPASYYDDYPQYENGVGFVRAFADEFLYELRRNIKDRENYHGGKYIIITGESAFESVNRLVNYAKNFYNINTVVIPVKNRFFGGGVNVTGLLTGGDIVSELSGKNLSGTVLLLEDMFKKDTDLFLDNKTLRDVENNLRLPCETIRRDGTEVFRKIAGI